jgi:hypothetical protein
MNTITTFGVEGGSAAPKAKLAATMAERIRRVMDVMNARRVKLLPETPLRPHSWASRLVITQTKIPLHPSRYRYLS